MSGWAEPRPLPWLFPYQEDAQSTRLGEPIFRPFVQVSLVHGDQSTSQLTGLIDTGADAILASSLLSVELGVDLEDHDGEATHAVGGRVHAARYKTIGLRLYPSDSAEDVYQEWQAPVGFVEGWKSDGFVLLGSVGFLDRFTVTASRFAQAVAVEDREAFDDRFGPVLSA
ncbi:MAG TPA: hypothetical protein VIJ66_13510 [Solirubrobacteraceae bacterium]